MKSPKTVDVIADYVDRKGNVVARFEGQRQPGKLGEIVVLDDVAYRICATGWDFIRDIQQWRIQPLEEISAMLERGTVSETTPLW